MAGAEGLVAELAPGQMAGQYRIEKLIGRGGMGAVYRASQPQIGAQVAIKVLDLHRASDERLVRRFVDEARAVNRIAHPSIIDIFAFGQLEDGRHYFAMEYLEGETLATRLERAPLYPTEAQPLLQQVCQALEAAHREGIVHRDLKPENIWIARPKYGPPFAKILDFGIAKLQQDRGPALTDDGMVIGTPQVMSPEQCRGESVDPRSDLYALGVLLYRLLSGRFPFEGASALAVINQQITASPAPPSLHRPISTALEQLILRCLAKDPAARPQSAAAVGIELDRILTDEGLSTTRPCAANPATDERSAKPRSTQAARRTAHRRAPHRLLLVSVSGLLLALATAFALWQASPGGQTDATHSTAEPMRSARGDLAATGASLGKSGTRSPLKGLPAEDAPQEETARPQTKPSSAHQDPENRSAALRPRVRRRSKPGQHAGRRTENRREQPAEFLRENPFR